MKAQVGIFPSGEIAVFTPLYAMHPDSMPLDKMEGYTMVLFKMEDPAAYAVEVQDICKVFGPSIIEHCEMLGDLSPTPAKDGEGV